LASISAPLLPLSPPPLFCLVFFGLCADLGVRNAVAITGSLDRFHLCLASLPLLASACTSHLGARPCVTLASLRSVLCLGVLSTPCFLFLLLELFFLLLFLALPSYCALVCTIVYFLCSCFLGRSRVADKKGWSVYQTFLCTRPAVSDDDARSYSCRKSWRLQMALSWIRVLVF
jgi:hypothetical protein